MSPASAAAAAVRNAATGGDEFDNAITLTVTHANERRRILLYPGIPPAEVLELLHAVFPDIRR
jgi:hypothetical protein